MFLRTLSYFTYLFALYCMPCSAGAISTELFPSELRRIDDEINGVLTQIRIWQQERPQSLHSRPFVLVSYAQSLDGRIALWTNNNEDAGMAMSSSNFPVSGNESLRLTHAIRSLQDGIIVGGRTLLIDNPRLNNRLWETRPGTTDIHPRPIVLDTNLEAVKNLNANIRMRNPIVCCSHRAAAEFQSGALPLELLPCTCTCDGLLDLEDVLAQLLSRHGIKSVMVEGGASVISSFLDLNLVDAVAITISPKLCRRGLLIASGTKENRPVDLATAGSKFRVIGTDAILLSLWPKTHQ